MDGRRVRRMTGLDVGQEAQAEALLAQVIDELRRAGEAPANPGSLREWGEKWIEDRKARGKLEWIQERSHLQHFVYPALGARPLTEVTDVQILDWARGLERQRGPSGKTPAPKYVRKITATVRALFKEATRRHLIEKTPCIWDDSDLPELEANARAMGAGFDLGRIVAKTAYNTRHRVLKATKTRVEKWIPIHPALAAILKAWREEGWERFMGRPPTPEDLIVPAVAALGTTPTRGGASGTTS